MYFTDNTDPVTKDFIERLEENLKYFLPDEISNTAEISFNEIVKNNDQKLIALSIHEPGIDISPNIYLNGFIEQYSEGIDLDDIMSSITEMYMKYRDPEVKGFDIGDITQFDRVADRLVTKIVNTELNKEFLSVVPHKEFGDLSVFAQIRLDEMNDSVASITIRQDILDRWDVSLDEVIDKATDNDLKITEPRLIPMDKVIDSMRATYEIDQESFLPEDDDRMIPMYVLSTTDKVNGAKLINQQEILDEISDYLHANLIILPSSIHEAIVIPMDTSTMDLNELSMMVKSINSEVVSKTDVLSDHPYVYSKDERSLFFEKDGEKVKMQFTKEKKEQTRGVKDRLKEATKKSKEQASARNMTKNRSNERA